MSNPHNPLSHEHGALAVVLDVHPVERHQRGLIVNVGKFLSPVEVYYCRPSNSGIIAMHFMGPSTYPCAQNSVADKNSPPKKILSSEALV